MEHNYVNLEEDSQTKSLVIYEKGNNLDGKDNLNELPAKSAIYMICGRVNGQPANPRFVGESENLQEAIRCHFDEKVPAEKGNECFKEFMTSIKIKTLVYVTVPGLSAEERLKRKEEWEEKYKPKCNEELNEIH